MTSGSVEGVRSNRAALTRGEQADGQRDARAVGGLERRGEHDVEGEANKRDERAVATRALLQLLAEVRAHEHPLDLVEARLLPAAHPP
eukprot:3533041-Prymnesium_polylepis.1